MAFKVGMRGIKVQANWKFIKIDARTWQDESEVTEKK